MEISLDELKRIVNIETPIQNDTVGIKQQVESILDLSNNHRLNGEYETAIFWAEKAQTLDKHHFEVYLLKGLSYFDKGEFINAFQNLSISLILSPDNVQIYIQIGNTLGQMDLHKEAIVCFTKALEKASNSEEIGMLLYNRAVSRSQINDDDYHLDFKMAAELNFEPAKLILNQIRQ